MQQNSFLVIDIYNEILNEAIAATAYETGTNFKKTFLQAKLAEEKTTYSNPSLLKWLLVLAIELNDSKQMKLFAGRYLEETINPDPAVEVVALKISGNGAAAKKLKQSIQLSDLKSYRVNFKKIVAGI